MIVATLLGQATALAAAERPAESIDVGFLEQEGIRATFRKTEDGWRSRQVDVSGPEALATAARSFDEPRSWRIAFRGRSHGSIASAPLARYDFYRQLGLQRIRGEVPRLSFRGRSAEFQSFAELEPLRPVVVTTGHIADPDGWSRHSSASVAIDGLAEQQARASMSHVVVMRLGPDGQATGPRPPRAADFRIAEVFVSRLGPRLVRLVCGVTDSVCVDRATGDASLAGDGAWVWVDGAERSLIGEASRLIDAEDFDGDGASELVFWLSAYNRDGYALYVPRENRWVEFTWNYH